MAINANRGLNLRSSVSRLTMAALVAAIGYASPAVAQSAPAESDDIIVTAQKREQSLSDVPLTISAVTAAQIERSGITSINEVFASVPGIQYSNGPSPSFSSINIRGAGSGSSDPSLEPSVGLFIDGVYMSRSVIGISDLLDIERVEVLFGPQGTLYGKNTNAGVISVITADPKFDFGLNAEVTGGNYDYREGKLSVTGPISDTLAFRIAGSTRVRDGIMRNFDGRKLEEIDSTAIRGKLLWEPSKQFTSVLTAYYSVKTGSMTVADTAIRPTSFFGQALDATGILYSKDPLDRKVFKSEPNDSNFKIWGGSLKMDYSFDAFTVTSITGLLQWKQRQLYDNDNISVGLASVNENLKAKTWTEELRVTSTGKRTLDWIVGGFYLKDQLDRGSLIGEGTPYFITDVSINGFSTQMAPFARTSTTGSGGWKQHHETESWGIFGQTTWNISPSTQLIGGLRYGADRKTVLVETDRSIPPGLIAFFWSPISQSDRISKGSFSWMGSINQHFGDHMVYASVATGEKSGGLDPTFRSVVAPATRRYKPEKTTNYEVGVKLDSLLGGAVRANISAFYTIYKDFQATAYDNALATFVVRNAAKQVTKGVDLDVTVRPLDGLSLSGKVEYLDARYKDFVGGSCHPSFLAATGQTNPNACDLSGQRIPLTSKWTGYFSADYNIRLKDDANLYLSAALAFRSKYLTDSTFRIWPDASQDYTHQSYTKIDARIGWQKGPWDISIWGKNLTDETYIVSTSGITVATFTGPTNSNRDSESMAGWINTDPRTYGLTVRYKM